MRKSYFLKSVVLMIAVFFCFSAVSAQGDGPKLVNFTEILTPVIGDDGPEPFPFMFGATSAWGDFNNDGYPDLIVLGMYEKYFEFDDDGNPIPNIDALGNEMPLPTGDINSDTRQPINLTLLYRNNGDGTFTQVEHPFPYLRMPAVAWLDYDNDGNLDVFMLGCNQDRELFTGLFRNQGPDGGFEFVEELPGEFEYLQLSEGEQKYNDNSNRATRLVAVGDYDNDGWTDIALTAIGETDKERRVSLYRNLEGQGFQKMEYLVSGSKPFLQHNGGGIAWGDYNRDGFLDLVTFGYLAGGQADLYPGYALNNGGACFLYKNNGDGTFAAPILFSSGEDGDIAWIDFNNDGYLDFVFGNFCWNPSEDSGWKSYFFMNKGDGTFEKFYNNDVGINGDQGIFMGIGDVNNDGYEDLLQNKANPTSLFLNNAGVFPFVRQQIVFDEASVTNPDYRTFHMISGAVNFVDFDNNGSLDIFINGRDDWNRSLKDHSFLLRNDLDEAEGIPFNQPPSAPTNLKAEVDADGVTTFTWDAATDDLTPQIALRYNLYVKQDDVIKMVLPADLTTGRLKVNEALAPIMGTTYTMSGLDGEYEWGVQAIDNGKMGGKFTKVGGTGIKKISNKVAVNVIGKQGAIEVRSAGALQGTLSVYSISGIRLYSKAGQINGSTVELPANGVYIVKVTTAEGTSVSKAVVK